RIMADKRESQQMDRHMRPSRQLWFYSAIAATTAIICAWRIREPLLHLFERPKRYRMVIARVVGMSYLPLKPDLAYSETRYVPRRGVGRKREAVDATPRSLSAWIELSAEHYEAGRVDNDPQELVRALAATDAALRAKSDSPEALFNRALTLH